MIQPPTSPLRRLPQPDEHHLRSTWTDAKPRRIRRALEAALARDPGGWFVAGASTDVRETSVVRRIAGREVASWRAQDGRLHAGPGACPHLGAACEPQDIIANRLDPWHGAWFHPYAFSHLSVDESRSTDDALFVEVACRLNRTWGVPVAACFTTPDARTIVMHFVEGEGAGSVVETRATPLCLPADGRWRTMMTEATLVHSSRAGFQAARRLAPLLRPAIRHTARRLWVDDLPCAERRCARRASEG